MSMLPPKSEEDDDDYVVDGRDPEEAEPAGKRVCWYTCVCVCILSREVLCISSMCYVGIWMID